MTLNANMNIWKEIFQIIQNNPAIWKIKSTEYRNKMKKSQAWDLILEKYKEIDPDGTMATIKNKITNIRTCYRRELKKVADSLKSGAGGEDVYIPSLWYFYELDFLRDQEEASESVSTVDFDVEALKEIRPKRNKSNPKQDFLQQACAQLESMNKNDDEDDATIHAKSWACSFRKLDPEQRLYAKKSIEEILILGELKQLTLHSIISPSMPSSSRTTNSNKHFSPSPPISISPMSSSSPIQYHQSPLIQPSHSASSPPCSSLPKKYVYLTQQVSQKVAPRKILILDQNSLRTQERIENNIQDSFTQNKEDEYSSISELFEDGEFC